MRRTPELLSFTFSMNSPTYDRPPLAWISSSMFRQASLAPPWAGPHRQATPAAIAANGLVPDEPHRRTVEVEAFCSWSACRMKMRSSARSTTSFTLYSSHGLANIMRRKLPVYDRLFCGYMKGWPCEYLYAIAT